MLDEEEFEDLRRIRAKKAYSIDELHNSSPTSSDSQGKLLTRGKKGK
jgi:hypothetical protein